MSSLRIYNLITNLKIFMLFVDIILKYARFYRSSETELIRGIDLEISYINFTVNASVKKSSVGVEFKKPRNQFWNGKTDL